MMRNDVREAIESACSREAPYRGHAPVDGKPMRWHTPAFVAHLLRQVIVNLPDDMTIMELREELEQ